MLVIKLKKKKLILWTLTLLIVLIIGQGIILPGIYAVLGKNVPTFFQFKALYQTSDKILLDHSGRILQESRIHFDQRKLRWSEIQHISPLMIKLVVQAEDKNFWKHQGVDYFSILKNIYLMIRQKKFHGASTIPMQLAPFIAAQDFQSLHRHSFFRKIKQILFGLYIDRSWKKEEILETYLNMVSYYGELQGITAAAKILFNKYPIGLNQWESMLLVALIRSPNASFDLLYKRLHYLNQQAGFNHSDKKLKSFLKKSLTYYSPSSPLSINQKIQQQKLKHHLAPHLGQEMFKTSKHPHSSPSPTIIQTTLDYDLQKYSIKTLKSYLNNLKTKNVQDGAILIVDNKTGKILSYVASSGALSRFPHVNGILAKRQAGSTLKPFLYGLGIEKNIFTAASIFLDAPLHLEIKNDDGSGRGIYHPRNYENSYHGYTTLRESLASSMNIPAVKAINILGVRSFVQLLNQLQFTQMKTSHFYGPSLALGAMEVSLWELVHAYYALFNQGAWRPLQFSATAPSSKISDQKIFSQETAFIIANILSDRNARMKTFGLESPLSTHFWSAVKTGTSKDMRDNWCIGFSQHYTVGVWVGNFSGESMWNVSGISGAAPIWSKLMSFLHQKQMSLAPKIPPSIEAKEISFSMLPHYKNSYWEYFKKGTLPSFDQISISTLEQNIKILYPVNDLIVAQDPDIPQQFQKLTFKSNIKKKTKELSKNKNENNFQWILNNKILGPAQENFSWPIKPGKYALKIVEGQTIHDQKFFTIK